MKIKYDKKVDALYFTLAKGKYSDSVKVSDNVMIDKDSKGNILGIEILDATENIPAFNPKEAKFQFQAV
ncbi:MAG TPA: DUF2283 domain-containing protein [Alphaproteobacteria bacterium]|jgi:uncharacterized protein YuzE|nr:DUF2283 domain-containing protein [Alphaproteobacteria bacterium]